MCSRALSARIHKAYEIKVQSDTPKRACDEEKAFITDALKTAGETKATTAAGHMATISRRTWGDGFDVKRFRSDYNDLYKNYCTKQITKYYAFSVK